MKFNKNSRKEYAIELSARLNECFTFEEIYSRYQGSANFKKNVTCPACGKKNKFKIYSDNCNCFSCPAHCKVLENLYMIIYGVGYYEALYTIARDLGVIDNDTFEECMNYTNNYVSKTGSFKMNEKLLEEKKKIREEEEKNKVPQAELAPIEKRNQVYRLIKKYAELKYGGLPDYLRNSLKLERNLSDERIDKSYFLFPKPNYSFYKYIFEEMEKLGYKPTDLIGVPGFYSEDMKTVKFVNRSGMGILMSGFDDLIEAIQIRAYDYIDKDGKMVLKIRLDENGEKIDRPKYYWCASSDDPNGCSTGSPLDVMAPEDNYKSEECYITEGKFKEEKIIDEFNSPVISVQGVGNWRGKVKPQIKLISERFRNLKELHYAYDADLCFNFSIFKNCKDIATEELKDVNLKMKMRVWDYKLGKGLDDLINNGHKDKLSTVNLYMFAERFNKYMEEIKRLYPNTTLTKILDENKNEVDRDIVYNIYKEKVLTPLGVYYLK